MAQATVSITLEGKRVDLSGDLPDSTAHQIIKQVTELLVEPPATEAPTA